MLMMRSLQNHCVASADHVDTGGGLMLMMCLVSDDAQLLWETFTAAGCCR